MKRALGEGKQFTNVSSFFADIARGMAKNEVIKGVSEEGPVHPTDTHPPLTQRLGNLNLTLEDVGHAATDLLPSKPAVGVIENLEELEQELTDAEHAMMIKTGEAEVASSETASLPASASSVTTYKFLDMFTLLF